MRTPRQRPSVTTLAALDLGGLILPMQQGDATNDAPAPATGEVM